MERILVIDDEASIRKALQIGLDSANYQVDLASDGESGILLGKNQAYDVVIADLSLPDITGLEVIKKIKNATPDIIPIIITGNGSMQSSLEAIRLEVSDYLEKPLNLENVKDAISRGVKKREEMRLNFENKVKHKISLDSLTGLPDRSVFLEGLKKAIAGFDSFSGSSFAIILINIDNFKGVNTTYGHQAGDMVLSELSERFQSCVRTSDTVARIGGDEFAVLIEESESEEIVTAIAERCHEMAAKSIFIDGKNIKLSASIGIVAKTQFYQLPDDILRDAELALSQCKEQGGGQIKSFDKNMLEQEIESIKFENDLRLGIKNREFILHYQPIVRLDDMRMVGLEALIRWDHPDHGIMYPDAFIPKAEEIGLINQIGDWVIREVCRQVQEWRRTLSGFDDISVNINISGLQFLQLKFVDIVEEIINSSALKPGDLKFEITESVLMKNSELSLRTLKALRDIGLKLVVDDFGNGYSSLSYLNQFPIDDIKIGTTFVQKLGVNTETYEIVKSIADLAKKLGLNVVGEGIETEEHLNQVKKLDFDMVQGFFIAKPADAFNLMKSLKRYLYSAD